MPALHHCPLGYRKGCPGGPGLELPSWRAKPPAFLPSSSGQNVADHIPQLVQGVRGSQAQAEDLGAQLALINSSQNFLQVCELEGGRGVGRGSLCQRPMGWSFFQQPGSKMVASAKAAVPTVTDQAAAMQLSQCAKNLATSLAELRMASQKVGRSPAPPPPSLVGWEEPPKIPSHQPPPTFGGALRLW